jgi:hypothetical protein
MFSFDIFFIKIHLILLTLSSTPQFQSSKYFQIICRKLISFIFFIYFFNKRNLFFFYILLHIVFIH